MKQEKIWLLLIGGKEEGPFSLSELRSLRRITPETLAKKIGDKRWKPLGKIPELRALFEDSVSLSDHFSLKKPEFKPMNIDDEIALNPHRQNPLFLILLVILFLLALLFFQYFR